jgi:uncharacterized protein YegP (UPF0339 family)
MNKIKEFFKRILGIRVSSNVGSFEVFKDDAGEWRWNLKASNNEIIATSEGYKAKQSCIKGIVSVQKYAKKAKVDELE